MKKAVCTTRWIVLALIICFAWTVQVSATPTRTESDSTPTAAASKEADGQGSVERMLPSKKAAKKKSIMPWILIGVGVVVVAAAVYFFVLNVKYTLTVTLAEGVSGSPAAGANKYKKGEAVPYSYTIAGGYTDLDVTLDGSPAAASGSVKMDKDHTLTATSTKVASIAVNSTPAGAMVYDNGLNSGKVTPAVLDYPGPGTHAIIVRKCGYQDNEQVAHAQMGQQQTVNVTLKPGIHDEFDTELSPCWTTSGYGSWKTEAGALRGSMDNNALNAIWNATPLTQTNYTFSTRMWMQSAHLDAYIIGLVLAENTDLTKVTGYMFWLYQNGLLYVVRAFNFNCLSLSGNAIPIAVVPTVCSAWQAWVEMRVVRSGTSYSVYLNGLLATSVVDATYNPIHAGMLFGSLFASEAKFEFFYLDYREAAAPPLSIRAKPPVSPTGHRPWPLKKIN